MPVMRVLLVGMLVVASSLCLRAADRIATPFQLVPLWSEEMMVYVTGERQQACSGENAPTCERVGSGICDGTVYFNFRSSQTRGLAAPPRQTARQRDAVKPQYFGLQIRNAGHSFPDNLHDFAFGEFRTIELEFHCQYSGNDECPAGRFQTGSLHQVELSVLAGDRKIDLTRAARVLPDGIVVVPINAHLKESFFADTRAIYQLRAVAECFSVVQSPIEWKLPVREAPSPDARTLGSVIARVMPGDGIDLLYRPIEGADVPFEADWTEPDWGYTYSLDQTVLDRKGDWFLLPRRPFPTAVWIHLPGRGEPSELSTGVVYSLSKKVRVRPTGAAGMLTLDPGHIVIVSIDGRRLEIRPEEPFDSCEDEDAAAGHKRPTYVVDAEELYDDDLHLQLRKAYPKGC